jgi:hypothetical protein
MDPTRQQQVDVHGMDTQWLQDLGREAERHRQEAESQEEIITRIEESPPNQTDPNATGQTSPQP